MKKIMVIQHCGVIGGSGIGLLAVLNMLRKQYEVVLYCVDSPDYLVKLYREHGYLAKTMRSIPTFNYHSGGPSILDVSFLIPLFRLGRAKKEWKDIIREESPDVVLVNSMVLAWMGQVIHDAGSKAICHVREVLPNRWCFRARKALANLEIFDAVWFISEHERNYFRLRGPQTAIIRDCVTQSEYKPTNQYSNELSDSLFRVLYVGGVSKLKGVDTLLRSLKHLDKGIAIDIAGSIPVKEKPFRQGMIRKIIFAKSSLEKEKLSRMFNKALNQYGDIICVWGHMNDISELYLCCNVLVFPSRFPHQARPAFEAGFYSKPVIISDFHQTSENIIDEYNGLTFKPRSPKDLAKSINRLNQNRALCDALGHNNYAEAKKKHTYEAVEIEMNMFWTKFIIE